MRRCRTGSAANGFLESGEPALGAYLTRLAQLPRRHVVNEGEANLGPRTVSYVVVRSQRARSVGLRITRDAVLEIVVPRHVTMPDIDYILRTRNAWILKHLKSAESSAPMPPGSVSYRGSPYRVAVRSCEARRGWVEVVDGTLVLYLPAGASAELLLVTFLQNEARRELMSSVETNARAMGVQYKRVRLGDQRTRWGSCSSLGNLNFNWRLIMAPLAVLEYVVVHELMHLRELNHSPQFWAGVAECCPEYKGHRAWLQTHGAMLGRPLSDAAAAPA